MSERALDIAEAARGEYNLYEARSGLERHGLGRSAARATRNWLREARDSGNAIDLPRIDVLLLALESRQYATLAPARRILDDHGLRTLALTAGPARPDLTTLQSSLTNRPTRLREAAKIAAAADHSARILVGGADSSTRSHRRVRRWLRGEAATHARWAVDSVAILDMTQPLVIVSADDIDPRIRWLLLRAHERGARTIRTQFGLSGDALEWISGLSETKAVHGPRMRRILNGAGIDNQRIVEVGQPRFGALGALADINDRSVLFASQPYVPSAFGSPAERANALRAVGAGLSAAKTSGWRVGIRAHPDEHRGQLWRSLAEGGLKRGIADESRMGLADVLGRYRVVLGFFSTVLVESMLAHRVVVRVQAGASSQLAQELDRVLPPVPATEIEVALDRAIGSEPGSNAVRSWLRDEFDAFPNDGRALAAEIESRI